MVVLAGYFPLLAAIALDEVTGLGVSEGPGSGLSEVIVAAAAAAWYSRQAGPAIRHLRHARPRRAPASRSPTGQTGRPCGRHAALGPIARTGERSNATSNPITHRPPGGSIRGAGSAGRRGRRAASYPNNAARWPFADRCLSALAWILAFPEPSYLGLQLAGFFLELEYPADAGDVHALAGQGADFLQA